MCPQASMLARGDINVGSSDEEIMRFLGGRKAGDPVPTNCITEVNPFNLEPWDAPEGMWYLYNFENESSCNQQSILKGTQIGYWKSMDHLTIFRDKVSYGRKIIWEFCMGQEPSGNGTGWMMLVYNKFEKACEGISAAQDWTAVCRIFLHENQWENFANRKKSSNREHYNLLNSNNVDDERVESMLLSFLEQEDRSSPTVVANYSEVGVDEVRNNLSCQDLLVGDSAGDLRAFVKFSKGEYLELKDLTDLNSTSSSSDDSILNSSYSDECFDAEALLKDLETESGSNIQDEGLNFELSDATSANPSQAAGSDKIEERIVTGSSPSDGCSPKNSIPMRQSGQRFSEITSASGSCLRVHPKRIHPGCSESCRSSSSSNGLGSKSVARIAKLGRKCCCFAPF